MQWTVRYFLHKSKEWTGGAEQLTISPGARAYALRQGDMWGKLADAADKVFVDTTSQYISPM
jgi:hypothetical protein